MSRLPLLLCLLFATGFGATAQQMTDDEFLLRASREIDENRYLEVRGKPYRYKTFRPAKVYDSTLREFELDQVNFNGFTSQFEYKQADGKIRELSGENFIRVTMAGDDGETHNYGFGINPKFRDKYAEILFRGDYVTATLIYDVANEEKVVQDVGKTVRLRRFDAKTYHFALVDGDFVTLSNNKKIAEDLGLKKQLGKFVKDNKLNPNKREDLIAILTEAERIYEEME